MDEHIKLCKNTFVCPKHFNLNKNACNKHIFVLFPLTFFAVIQNFEDHCKL